MGQPVPFVERKGFGRGCPEPSELYLHLVIEPAERTRTLFVVNELARGQVFGGVPDTCTRIGTEDLAVARSEH